MPYKRAHWAIAILLLPIVVLAFWKHYFGVLGQAPFGYHAHGITATGWFVLIAAQSWAIHTRRITLHRSLGLSVFAAVPLFVGAGMLVIQSMAIRYVTKHDPFAATLGAQICLHDLVSSAMVAGMVAMALRNRRRVAIHAGYLLGTILLVMPPVLSRLPLDGIVPDAVMPWLSPGLALLLAAIERRGAEPMLVTFAALVLHIYVVAPIGQTVAWSQIVVAYAAFSAPALALVSALAALVALGMVWIGWRAGPKSRPRRKPAVAAAI